MSNRNYLDLDIPEIHMSASQEAELTDEDSDYEEKRKQKYLKKREDDWKIIVEGKQARKNNLKRDSGIVYDMPIVNNDSTTQLWRRIQNEPPEKVRAAPETAALFNIPLGKGGRTRKLRRVKRRKTRKLRKTKKVRQPTKARKSRRIRK